MHALDEYKIFSESLVYKIGQGELITVQEFRDLKTMSEASFSYRADILLNKNIAMYNRRADKIAYQNSYYFWLLAYVFIAMDITTVFYKKIESLNLWEWSTIITTEFILFLILFHGVRGIWSRMQNNIPWL